MAFRARTNKNDALLRLKLTVQTTLYLRQQRLDRNFCQIWPAHAAANGY